MTTCGTRLHLLCAHDASTAKATHHTHRHTTTLPPSPPADRQSHGQNATNLRGVLWYKKGRVGLHPTYASEFSSHDTPRTQRAAGGQPDMCAPTLCRLAACRGPPPDNHTHNN